jgi:hypothetical protein
VPDSNDQHFAAVITVDDPVVLVENLPDLGIVEILDDPTDLRKALKPFDRAF